MQRTYIITDDAGDEACSALSLSAAILALADLYGLHAQLECLEDVSDLHLKRAAAAIAPLGFTVRQVVAE